MTRINEIITMDETKEISIFNTHTKYIMQEFIGNAKDVLERYGSEYVVTVEENEKGIDIFY